MARSIDARTENEEDGEEAIDIWTENQVAIATTAGVTEYIATRINDYNEKGLIGADLFEYWRCDFENFIVVAYKKTIEKTRQLRDYLLNNRV